MVFIYSGKIWILLFFLLKIKSYKKQLLTSLNFYSDGSFHDSNIRQQPSRKIFKKYNLLTNWKHDSFKIENKTRFKTEIRM